MVRIVLHGGRLIVEWGASHVLAHPGLRCCAQRNVQRVVRVVGVPQGDACAPVSASVLLLT
jgi:hypothetical protein